MIDKREEVADSDSGWQDLVGHHEGNGNSITVDSGAAEVVSPPELVGLDSFIDDQERAADLKRMKRLATALFVLAAVIFVVAKVGEESQPWLGYVRATAEAAMIGALADWFAVTALFKHPLGLPIPHTAIIQKRKDQIGASLGGFVKDNFLTREVVTERLVDAELAGRLGGWLANPANARKVGDQSAAVVKAATEVLQDEAVQSGLESLVVERAKSIKVAPIAGQLLETAMDGDHHQVMLEGVFGNLNSFMTENRETFRDRLIQESPWWVPEAVDDKVFDRIYAGVRSFLTDLGNDRDHPVRKDLDVRTAKLAQELRKSPELIAKGEAVKAELLEHPEVKAWSSTLWARIKAGLIEASEDPESELRLRLEQALVEAGENLASDPELRAKIDRWITESVGYVAEQFRGEVADLIATTVQGWDTAETAERMELQVGRDLQFIRINGTLVGGLAGLAIYTLSEQFL